MLDISSLNLLSFPPNELHINETITTTTTRNVTKSATFFSWQIFRHVTSHSQTSCPKCKSTNMSKANQCASSWGRHIDIDIDIATATAAALWLTRRITYSWTQRHVLVRIGITATYIAKSAYPWILCNWILVVDVAVLLSLSSFAAQNQTPWDIVFSFSAFFSFFLQLLFACYSRHPPQFNNIFICLSSEVNAEFFFYFSLMLLLLVSSGFYCLNRPMLLNCNFSSSALTILYFPQPVSRGFSLSLAQLE